MCQGTLVGEALFFQGSRFHQNLERIIECNTDDVTLNVLCGKGSKKIIFCQNIRLKITRDRLCEALSGFKMTQSSSLSTFKLPRAKFSLLYFNM